MGWQSYQSWSRSLMRSLRSTARRCSRSAPAASAFFVSKRAITLFVLTCRPTRAPKLATILFSASFSTCVQACYHSQPRAL